MTLTQRREATGLVVLAVTGWSFPGVFVRFMPHLAPLPLVAIRLTVACLALTPFALAPKARANAKLAVSSWRCWLLAACMLLYYSVATPAFHYAPIGEVALIIASAPLFAVILRLIAGQPVSRNEVGGAILAVGGVLVMALTAKKQTAGEMGPEWIGILLSVTAAIAAAVYTIGNRHLLDKGGSPGAVAQVWLTFCLGLLLLPFVSSESGAHLHSANLAWAIPLGAFSTALPTVAVAATSHRLHPVAATMINPLTAIFASVVAAFAVHEVPNAWTLLGGAMVITAVYVATRKE